MAPERTTKSANRREHAREDRARAAGTWRSRALSHLLSWRVISSVIFTLATSTIAWLGEATLGYSIGQQIDQPVFTRVAFQVPDDAQTEADREAARAATPNYCTQNANPLTFDRIRADLMRVYEAAVNAETIEEYEAAVKQLGVPAEAAAYERLHALADDAGRATVQSAVDQLPLENEFVIRDLMRSPLTPASVTGFIRLELEGGDAEKKVVDIPHADLVLQGNERALEGSAAGLARRFSIRELAGTVRAVVLEVFRDQPTIIFNRERTNQAMLAAAEQTPIAMTAYAKDDTLVNRGVIRSEEYDLLRAEHDEYTRFLLLDTPEALGARHDRLRQRLGLVTIVALLSVGLLTYVGLHHPRIFEVRARTIAFMTLVLGTLLAVRLIDMRVPEIPELVLAPMLIAGSVLAITYPQRLAMGATCIVAVLVGAVVNASFFFMVTLFTGVVVAVFQLDEIRLRTKLITAGVITSAAVILTSTAGWCSEGQSVPFVAKHAIAAGVCALLASFVVSGVLPLIERLFRVATSLTLLEWRDPTRPLLHRLAREAQGTYNHSLALGTLAEAACESIGANGLLAQVGALYHDIGKIPKAHYFAENQEGQISRHDNLAPTMSLLIIVGHVKDGIEMAKEYRLPRVLHQFIDEHHGTTVVRYFHHMASEKQPRIASGKHDREIRESEFRYGGPKPSTRESAVLMLCDGVEGAVRALPEPTPSRIEGVVHELVSDRLNDGQFDDCDITLKEIRRVSDSLIKTLCGMYHGRVAYPKARKGGAEKATEQKGEESKSADHASARAG